MFIPPLPALTINIQVDSLALLSGSPVQEAVWIVDTSGLTQGKGGCVLRSVAVPGQRVRWTLTSVDLQAPAWLKRIAFVASDDVDMVSGEGQSDPSSFDAVMARPSRAVSWEGFIPPTAEIGTAYPYQIHLSFGNEKGIPVVLTGSELEIHAEVPPEVAGGSGWSWANSVFSTAGEVL